MAQAIRPPNDEARAEATRLLRALRRTTHPKLSRPSGERAELPGPAEDALIEALAAIAAGRDVMVVPADRDLTTGQAADLLGVSRQYLVRLLDDEAIPSYLVGSHRRVRLEHLMRFKARRDEKRRAALREMVREAEAAGLIRLTSPPTHAHRSDCARCLRTGSCATSGTTTPSSPTP